MDVNFYINSSPPNYVDKTISLELEEECTFKQPTSITDPVLLINDDNSVLPLCNYVYIPSLNRYYFIKDIVSIHNDLWQVSCHVDVLMSNATQIKAQSALVARQENVTNTYLSDPRIKVQTDPYVQQIQFPNGFVSAWTYCLALLGN